MIWTMTRTLRAYVSSACGHATNVVHKQFWLCNPTMVEGSDYFATRGRGGIQHDGDDDNDGNDDEDGDEGRAAAP